MASPQKEDGYTAIANEIMEALVNYRIPGEQMQCLLFILRKTYGFNKKWDAIANSQLVRATGLKKQHVYRAIKGLIDKNIVTKKGYNPAISYCFNKNYKTWKVSPKKVTVTNIGKKRNQKRGPQKTIQKTFFVEGSFPLKLSTLLYNLILQNNPNYKKPNLQTWAKHIDIMLRVDKRDTIEIEQVIRWCQKDDFWHTNILSTAKLRKQFDQLSLKMNPKKPPTKKLFDIDGKELTPEKIKEMKGG